MQTQGLPRGDAGIVATLERMKRAAREEYSSPLVRAWATKATAGCRPYDHQCRAFRILEFLREHMQFTPDPRGVEAVGTPGFHLAQLTADGRMFGDCDDAAVLAASLALSVGMPARFVAASFKADGAFHHVWTEGYTGAAWQELDPFRSERFNGQATRLLRVEV